MIKAILFDWHGVLDLVRAQDLAHYITDITGKEYTEVYKELEGLDRAYVINETGPSIFWPKVQSTFTLSNEQILAAKETILQCKKNTPLWMILPSLRKDFLLGIISDCPTDKLDIIRAECDLSFFTHQSFSCEMHDTKLSDKFFLGAATEMGTPREEILYVDDNLKNIEKARRLGFVTCHFRVKEDLLSAIHANR